MNPVEDRGRGGDAWGGFAAMLVALPAAAGYGLHAFRPLGDAYAGQAALAGLIGAVAVGLVAAVAGGTPRLISAPCGPAAAVLAAFGAELAASGVPAPKILLSLALIGGLAGLLQVGIGLLGGGRLIKYIPYPVVAGYLSGVGLLLFSGQVPKLLGLARAGDLLHPGSWALPGLAIGLATIAGMLAGPRLTRKVPAVVIGIAAGAAAFVVALVLDPSLRTLAGNRLVIGAGSASAGDLLAALEARIGSLPGLEAADLRRVVAPSLTLGVLLSIDTLKTCVIVDAMTRSRHDSNRELRGQGLANLLSSAAGGMPGAGTLGATLVNVGAGGATRRSGILAGAFALAAVVLGAGLVPGLPNLVGWIPQAALAGVILVVSARMVDRHALDLARNRHTVPDFVVILAVVVTALASSLIAAAAVGLALAILLFIREQVRGSVVRHRIPGSKVSSKRNRPAVQVEVLQRRGEEAVVLELQGTLFFGTTDQLYSILEPDLERRRFVVLDLRRVHTLDYTAAHLLDLIESRLEDRNAFLLLAGIPASLPTGLDLKAYFDHVGLVKRDRNVRVFDTADAAIEWYEERMLEEEGRGEAPSAPALALADFELFKDLDATSLALLASAVRERSVAAGEAVFRRGDPGDEVYFIRRGRVEILLPLADGRRYHLATFSRQGFFGDLAFLDRGTRSADAVAAKDTELYALSRARFDEVSAGSPALGVALFSRLAWILAHRLRQTDAELSALEEA